MNYILVAYTQEKSFMYVQGTTYIPTIAGDPFRLFFTHNAAFSPPYGHLRCAADGLEICLRCVSALRHTQVLFLNRLFIIVHDYDESNLLPPHNCVECRYRYLRLCKNRGEKFFFN